MSTPTVHTSIDDLAGSLAAFRSALRGADPAGRSGLVGFDGFVDTFIRMRNPASMAEFGPKVSEAAGIAASYAVDHQGDKFGGNGPLFARALDGILPDETPVTYIGGVGRDRPEPLFEEALRGYVRAVHTLAPPAHSDCLEFSDGKIMLGDFDACAEITLERLLEVVGDHELDRILQSADFIGAVNWGKLPHVGDIWSELARRLGALDRAAKEVVLFMDLAEFEHRSEEDVEALKDRLGPITAQCATLLSFNLKEAWQMGERCGGDFRGRKEPEAVAELASLLHDNLDVDRVIIHPNDGAACASAEGATYVPGPFCREPLVSTGAGDNFGAGCLAAALLELDDTGILLAGNAASGYYVRSGRSPSLDQIVDLVDAWADGSLPERL